MSSSSETYSSPETEETEEETEGEAGGVLKVSILAELEKYLKNASGEEIDQVRKLAEKYSEVAYSDEKTLIYGYFLPSEKWQIALGSHKKTFVMVKIGEVKPKKTLGRRYPANFKLWNGFFGSEFYKCIHKSTGRNKDAIVSVMKEVKCFMFCLPAQHGFDETSLHDIFKKTKVDPNWFGHCLYTLMKDENFKIVKPSAHSAKEGSNVNEWFIVEKKFADSVQKSFSCLQCEPVSEVVGRTTKLLKGYRCPEYIAGNEEVSIKYKGDGFEIDIPSRIVIVGERYQGVVGDVNRSSVLSIGEDFSGARSTLFSKDSYQQLIKEKRNFFKKKV